MNPTDYVVTDDRTQLDSPTQPPPLGAVVAWNGASADGQPRRAVVIERDPLVLLDGTAHVNLPEVPPDLVVLADSADRYAQRVSATARRLGRENNFCDLAERVVEELNRTPADGDRSGELRVEVTVTGYFRLRPNPRYLPDLDPRNLATIARALRETLAPRVTFDQHAFRTLSGTDRVARVELRLVDALPGDAEPTEPTEPTEPFGD